MKEQKEKSAGSGEQNKEDNKINLEFEEGKKEPDEKSGEEIKQEEEFISQIEKLQKEIEELNDRLLRRAAEFENYKRRTENEFQNFLKYAGEALIIEILPVYDDLGRSLNHVDEENSNESLAKGLKMVYDKFSKVLDDKGVKRIESKGHEFDFNFHEALLQKPTNEFPPNTVIEELEPGYIYKDKVIKHAKVIVSKEAE